MTGTVSTASKLKEMRERAGLSMDRLAKAIGFAAGSSYQRYEMDESYAKRRYIAPDIAEKIAKVIVGKGDPPIRLSEVMALAGIRENAVVDFGVRSHAKQSLGIASMSGVRSALGEPVLFGPRDLKVLGFAKAGRIGWYSDNGSTLEMTERPPMLISVPDAYAVYVDERSMFPVLRPGHLLWVHPRKPAKPEDLVIVQLKDGQAFVKELVRRTEKAVICRQYNPDEEVKYPADAILHVVVGIRTSG